MSEEIRIGFFDRDVPQGSLKTKAASGYDRLLRWLIGEEGFWRVDMLPCKQPFRRFISSFEGCFPMGLSCGRASKSVEPF